MTHTSLTPQAFGSPGERTAEHQLAAVADTASSVYAAHRALTSAGPR